MPAVTNQRPYAYIHQCTRRDCGRVEITYVSAILTCRCGSKMATKEAKEHEIRALARVPRHRR